MTTVEIYFDDLTEEKQKELLKAVEAENPEDTIALNLRTAFCKSDFSHTCLLLFVPSGSRALGIII